MNDICKFCGSVNTRLTNLGVHCDDCLFWEDEKYPIIAYADHRWYVGELDCTSNLVSLARVNWMSDFKRNGYVVRTIQAHINDLPAKVRDWYGFTEEEV